MKLKRGRQDQWGGYVDVNTFDTTAFASGPINEEGTLTLSVRRSYIDAILNAVAADELKFNAAPVYYDYQAQWDQRLSKKDDLRVFVYGSDDSLELFLEQPINNDPAASGGLGSHVYFHGVQSRWEHRFNKDVTLTSSLLGVKQELGFQLGAEIDFLLDLYRLGWREDVNWRLSDQFDLDFGMDVDYVLGRADITAPLPRKRDSQTRDRVCLVANCSRRLTIMCTGTERFTLKGPGSQWTVLPGLSAAAWIGLEPTTRGSRSYPEVVSV